MHFYDRSHVPFQGMHWGKLIRWLMVYVELIKCQSRTRNSHISKYTNLHSRKLIWNCHLKNGGHFVSSRYVDIWELHVHKHSISLSRGQLTPKNSKSHLTAHSHGWVVEYVCELKIWSILYFHESRLKKKKFYSWNHGKSNRWVNARKT